MDHKVQILSLLDGYKFKLLLKLNDLFIAAISSENFKLPKIILKFPEKRLKTPQMACIQSYLGRV